MTKDVRDHPMGNTYLECSACRKEAKVLGSLIVIPTSLGIIFAILMCFSTVSARSNMFAASRNFAESTGLAAGASFDLCYPLCVGLCSIMVGSVGWLFIMKKNLYKCVSCNHPAHQD